MRSKNSTVFWGFAFATTVRLGRFDRKMVAQQLVLPEGYGLVFYGIFASGCSNLYCALNVQRLRHKFGVPYPSLYATEAHMSKQCKKGNIDTFNCAQRAHQNTLESLTWVQVQGALVGLLFPRFAAACLLIYAVGRVLYCIGYTRYGPDGRVLGGAISQVGAFFPLLLATAYCGWMLTVQVVDVDATAL